jgi:hypothetical protein
MAENVEGVTSGRREEAKIAKTIFLATGEHRAHDEDDKSLRAQTFSFSHFENAIDAGDGNFFDDAAGPVNFEFVDLCCGSQAEMDARVGTGCEAAAAEDVGALADAPSREEDFRSDSIAWAFCAADQFQGDPVI